jgi:hypothetical protein
MQFISNERAKQTALILKRFLNVKEFGLGKLPFQSGNLPER